MKQPFQFLEQIPLFKQLKPETLLRLSQAGRMQSFSRKQIFHRSQEPMGQLYIQMEGKTIVYNMTKAGHRRILFIFGPGDILNLELWTAGRSGLYYEALEKGSAFCIPLHELSLALAADPKLSMAFMEEQERKLLRLSHQLKNTVGGINLDRKLAAKLWKLARDFGVPSKDGPVIDINLTVTLLADLLGAPRETISRACKSLTEKNLIIMTQRRVTVPDMDRIQHYFHTGEIL